MSLRLKICSALTLLVAPTGCGGADSGLSSRLRSGAAAIESRDVDRLWALHHPVVQTELSKEKLEFVMGSNTNELEDHARAFATGKANKRTAEVRLRSGDVVGLVWRDDRWFVSEGPFGAVDLSTPLQALRAFRAALRQQRLGSFREVLGSSLRAKRDFSVAMLLEQTEDIHALELEELDERARFRSPAGVSIVFVLENEKWRLEQVQAE